MRVIGYAPSRPNVLPANIPKDVLPEKHQNVVKDVCDNCKKYMLVYRNVLLKRRFKNKIYCSDCYNNLSKEDRKFKGADTIQRGGDPIIK